ncbi:MAG: DUF1207 domain-containing protein [bacterium]
MNKFFFLSLFIFYSAIFGQDSVKIFPGDLTVKPFAANVLEPKLGFLFQVDHNELRLDIGNSLDVIRFKIDDDAVISFGADLFTFTLLRSEDNFHFPVDAVDYLFGINAGYKISRDNTEYGFRFRLSHISAHLADGHFDKTNNEWKDEHSPRVFSKEFLELIYFLGYEQFRFYGGITYNFHIDPVELGKDNYQIGIEYFFDNVISDYLTPYIAYDGRLAHLDEYVLNNSLCAGIKFGHSYGKGVSLYFQYYSGNSIHGEYFDYKTKYSAFGINLDL